MAIKTVDELITAEPIEAGGPFYIFSTRSVAVDSSDSMEGGGPFYTPHYVAGGTPPVVYNATQFFVMF